MHGLIIEMGDKDFDCQLRKLTTGTKLSTLLRERPLIVLKQETTIELALQVRILPPCLSVHQLRLSPDFSPYWLAYYVLRVVIIESMSAMP